MSSGNDEFAECTPFTTPQTRALLSFVDRRWLAPVLLSFAVTLAVSPSATFAQGSAGGSIGNDDKAVSGSRPEPRAVERERPTARKPTHPISTDEDKRRSPRPSNSRVGSGGNFDGAWSISSAGVTCPDTFRETVVVTSGKLVGNYGGGSVSGNGSVSGSGNYNGIRVTSQGPFFRSQRLGDFQAV